MSPVVAATNIIGEFEENGPGRRSGMGWGRRGGGGGGGSSSMVISVPRAGKSKAGAGTVAERIMAANGIKLPSGQAPQRSLPPLQMPPLPSRQPQQLQPQLQPLLGPQPQQPPTGTALILQPAVVAAATAAAGGPPAAAATAAVPADAEATVPLSLAAVAAAAGGGGSGGGGGGGLGGPASPRQQRSQKLAAAIEEPPSTGCCSLVGCFRGPRPPTVPSVRPGPSRDPAGGPPSAPSTRFTSVPSSGRGPRVEMSSFRQANHSIKHVPFSARSRSAASAGTSSLSPRSAPAAGSGRLQGPGIGRSLSGGSRGDGSDGEFEELEDFVDEDVDSVRQQASVLSEEADEEDSSSPPSPTDAGGAGNGGGGGSRDSRNGSTPAVRPAGAVLAYRESHRMAPKGILKSAKPRNNPVGLVGEGSGVLVQSEMPSVPRNRVVLKHPSHDTDDEDGPGPLPYNTPAYGGTAVPAMSMYGPCAPPGFTSTSLNNIPVAPPLTAPPLLASEDSAAANGCGGGGESADDRRSAFAAAKVSSSIKLTAEELLALLMAQGKLTQNDVQELGLTVDSQTSSELATHAPPPKLHTATVFALSNLPSLYSAGGSGPTTAGGGGGGSAPRISNGGAAAAATTFTALAASAFPTTPVPSRPNATTAATAAAAENIGSPPGGGENTLILQNPRVRFGAGNQATGWGGGGGGGGSGGGTTAAATAATLGASPSINHRVHFGNDRDDSAVVSEAVMNERNSNGNGGGPGRLGNGTAAGPNGTADVGGVRTGTTGWAMYAAQRRPPVPLPTDRFDRYDGMGGTKTLRDEMGIPGTSSKALQVESCGPSRASSPPTSAAATRPNPLPVVPRHLPAADSRRFTATPAGLLGLGTRGAFAAGGNTGFRVAGGSGSGMGIYGGGGGDRTAVPYRLMSKRSSDSGVVRMVSSIGDDDGDGGVRIARSNARHSYCGNPAAAWAAATAAVVRAGRGSGDGGGSGGMYDRGAVELLALRKLQSHMRRSGANRAADESSSTAAAAGGPSPGQLGNAGSAGPTAASTHTPLDVLPSKARSVRFKSTVAFDVPRTEEEEQEDCQAAAAAAAAVAVARDRTRSGSGVEVVESRGEERGGGRGGRESGGSGTVRGGGGGGLLGLESFGNGGG